MSSYFTHTALSQNGSPAKVAPLNTDSKPEKKENQNGKQQSICDVVASNLQRQNK